MPKNLSPHFTLEEMVTTLRDLCDYSVDACVVGYKLENDSDFHVVLQGTSGETMIVEFPEPRTAPRALTRPG